MTTKTKMLLAAFAAVVIVSTAVLAGMQNHNNQAYGQQSPDLYPSRERTISVTGSVTTSISPDQLNVQFGVDTQAKTAQDAINSNSQAMNSVVSAVENLGITQDEISTASFTISPVYNDSNPYLLAGSHQSVLVGYMVSNTVLIKTTKLSLAGNVIDAAVGAGANRVDDVSFSLSTDKQQSVQDDLLNKAVLNAKDRAGKALDPLAQKIIGVKMVNISEFNMSPPPRYYGAMSTAAAPSTPIFTSNQQVTTTVDVTFLIGDQ
ncbi:MAG: SIMPL domain-containing protein [Nitrosotalea sp.]